MADADAMPTAIGMAGFSGVLVAGRRLSLRGRDAAAAVVTGSGLIAMTVVIAILYDYASVAMLMPIIAFLIVVPHLTGRSLVMMGLPAFLAACLAAASPLLPHSMPNDGVWDALAAVAGGFVGLAVLFVVGWRQVRDREAATSRFETMVQDLPLAVVRLREDARPLDANAAFYVLLTEALGGPATEFPRLTRTVLAADSGAPTWVFELGDSAIPIRGLARWVDATPDGRRVVEVALEDLRPHLEARRASERLVDIVRGASDAILTVDRDDVVQSWNAAAERIFGWTAEEIVGLSIDRILPPERIDEHGGWRSRILAGETITNLETERVARDGTRRTVIVTLSPLHAADGFVTGMAAIERDVTEERSLAARLEAEGRRHRAVREALAHLKARPTAEQTADAICETISGTEAFAHAVLLAFAPDETVSALAVWSERRSQPDLRPHIDRAAREEGHLLLVRARSGPWVEDLAAGEGLSYRTMVVGAGIDSLAFVPLAVDGDVLGLLVAATIDGAAAALRAQLSTFADFGAAAAAVIGSQLAQRRADEIERRHLDRNIRASQFRPVFQPIVEMASGAVLGYEALTRFTTGASPEGVFAAAARLGLGLELEAATLRVAMGEAVHLPRNAMLHVNVSPELVKQGAPLTAILRAATRPIVLEITEHHEITDYAALRTAIGRLPQPVRIAVDDAGAGFASLRHILELRPSSVKLDRRLVSGVDADPARQALIAGMVHYAARAGCALIAEGVETAEERRMLLDLGITLGQGYLLGRPGPAAHQARLETERTRGRPVRTLDRAVLNVAAGG